MKINDIRYNAASGSFEARVDIERDGRMYRYPCAVAGPLDMDMSTVRASLSHQAKRMSDTY
tara:strand:- start:316 stop:498 length:183 start_codon:yes stop_codon:yes gene_type:complete